MSGNNCCTQQKCCQKGSTNWIYNTIGWRIKWSLGNKEFESCSTLPTTIIGVIGMPQMVFTNLIMTIHVNKTTNQPLISSMVVKRYRCHESKKMILETICYNCTNS
jgi:hypothetical protein